MEPAKAIVLSIVVLFKSRKTGLPSTFKDIGNRLNTNTLSLVTALLVVIMFSGSNTLFGQTDTISVPVSHVARIDTIKGVEQDTLAVALQGKLISLTPQPGDQLYLSPETKKKRVILNTAVHAGIYVGSMIILNKAWYANYPRSSFHTFNDFPEWLQMDKFGHAWSAYQISRTSMATWQWAGLSPKKQIWYGGLAGMVFQTVIEVQDGFSAEWGWSWGDIGANIVGSGLLIAQQLAWHEQRISYKFSFHRMSYGDPMLNVRSDSLYGTSLQSRTLKDYNGQAYWLSANLKSFFPKSNLPAWLNVAVGYGANGMFGATDNKWTANGISYDRSDIKRVREFYLAPDIDFTRIPTKNKWLKRVFFVLNAFKFPAPALMLSNGKLQVKALYF